MSADRSFGLLQWWASMTVGLVAISHFAGKRLNFSLLVVLIGLYCAFSAYMAALLNLIGREQFSYLESLRQLEDGGLALTEAGRFALASSEEASLVALIFFAAVVLGSFLASVGYSIYVYRIGRHTR